MKPLPGSIVVAAAGPTTSDRRLWSTNAPQGFADPGGTFSNDDVAIVVAVTSAAAVFFVLNSRGETGWIINELCDVV